MNKKITIVLLLAACIFSSTFAQDANEQETTTDQKSRKKNSITFYPLNLLDIINGPCMLIGYERRMSETTAVKVSGGILPFGNAYEYLNAYADEYRYSCNKVNIEFKYIIFTSNSLKRNVYLSSDVFFSHVYANEMVIKKDLIGDQWDEIYKYDLNKYGINFKIGKQFVLNRFILEVYGGVGIAKHNKDIYKKERVFEPLVSPYDEITDKSVDYYRINFPINILVGFTF